MTVPNETPLGEINHESVQARVLRVIATARRVPVETLTPESSFEELGIDSLDRINLLFDLENEFDLSIDDEQAKSIANIPQMVTGIEEMLRAKEAGAA